MNLSAQDHIGSVRALAGRWRLYSLWLTLSILVFPRLILAQNEGPGPAEEQQTVEIASLAPIGAASADGEGSTEATRGTNAKGGFKFTLLDNSRAEIRYSRKGLEFRSKSGNYAARIRGRIELRDSYPFDSDPRKEAHFGAAAVNSFDLRRARLKVDGNVFGKWLTYNYEHDLVDNQVLNLFAVVKAKEWLQFRGGQGKVSYSRERVTSSSKQQFVERSIVNRDFTVDRQIGFEVLGHLMAGTRGDSWYYAGISTGTGRGNGFEGGGRPMLTARYQWNFLGQDLDYSSSDIEYHERPAASVALAGAANRSRYTRFSSSGGGQLDAFKPGLPGQYSLKQLMAEFSMKYRGLSVENENHWKNIFDNADDKTTDMVGSYVQSGYVISNLIPAIPRQAEIGYRYGIVDNYSGVRGNLAQEHSVVLNLFLEGHDNKLSFDVGRLSLARPGKPELRAVRYRLQWDIHF